MKGHLTVHMSQNQPKSKWGATAARPHRKPQLAPCNKEYLKIQKNQFIFFLFGLCYTPPLHPQSPTPNQPPPITTARLFHLHATRHARCGHSHGHALSSPSPNAPPPPFPPHANQSRAARTPPPAPPAPPLPRRRRRRRMLLLLLLLLRLLTCCEDPQNDPCCRAIHHIQPAFFYSTR
jgi:hypothetical protein